MKTGKHAVAYLRGITVAVAVSLASAPTLWADLPKATAPPPPSMAAVQSAYGHLPISFEANQGQTDSRVNYLARGHGYTLLLTPSEVVLVLKTGEAKGEAKGEGKESDATQSTPSSSPPPTAHSVVRMTFDGANPHAEVVALDKLPGIVNYFIGGDPSKWRTNIPTYKKVEYTNVYAGIDLVYYGNQGQLEYDLIVAPGADPNQIQLAFEGAEQMTTDESGNLVLAVHQGQVRLLKPQVYQVADGKRTAIAASYVLHASNSALVKPVGIQLAAYDVGTPLIIDPVLSYATYLGGGGDELGRSIAVDIDGNAYVTGSTLSANFPTTAGAFQVALSGIGAAFVTKFNPTGTALVYSTYLGGSGSADGDGIAVDTTGNAYVTGSTGADFPTTTGAFQTAFGGAVDAFVTKLNPTGSALVYSTYLGGSSNDQFDGAAGTSGGIAVDATGNAYVTGDTESTDFPITAGAFQTALNISDAFVTKLNPAGSALVYSTYLGGSQVESGHGIAVDASGQAYVTGLTASSDFPITTGALFIGNALDVFVSKLNSTGTALVYSTYLSGNSTDYGTGIAVDATENAYVTGLTCGGNFPITAGAFQTVIGDASCQGEAFVTKLSSAGTVLYSTYLGGIGADQAMGIAVDASGQAYVTGLTGSSNFPTTAGAFQVTLSGIQDAFVTKLNSAGSGLVYSTYHGGIGNDQGRGIGLDASGNAYVTGLTRSADFPTSAGAFDAALSGTFDVFVTKISFEQSPGCNAAVANPASLWTPDGQLVPIVVTGVTDPDGDSLTITVTTVTQDEPVKGKGDKTSPDAVIQAGSSSVRAERLNSGNGRVYQISFRADDGKGGSCTGAVKVGVPLSLKKGLAAIDDGQIYNSTIP